MVASTTQTVVSAVGTRELSGVPGGSAGAVTLLKLSIVVGIGLLRLTCGASGSTPTFTDQRSTPHVGLWIVSVMGSVSSRSSSSLIVVRMFFTPVGMNGPMVASKENVLSTAV